MGNDVRIPKTVRIETTAWLFAFHSEPNTYKVGSVVYLIIMQYTNS